MKLLNANIKFKYKKAENNKIYPLIIFIIFYSYLKSSHWKLFAIYISRLSYMHNYKFESHFSLLYYSKT